MQSDADVQKDISTVEAALSGAAREAFSRLMGTWAEETADWQRAAGLSCDGTPKRLADAVARNVELVRRFK